MGKVNDLFRKFMNKPYLFGLAVAALFMISLLLEPNVSDDQPILKIIMCSSYILAWTLIYYLYRKGNKENFIQGESVKSVLLGMVFSFPLIIIAGLMLLGGLEEAICVIPPLYMILFIVQALKAGACEEIVLRGLFCGNLMRVKNSTNDIFRNAMVPAALFGLLHLFNLFAGAGVWATISQVLYAFGIGFLFSAAYIRSGSLLSVIIVHTLVDACSFISDALKTGITDKITTTTDTMTPVGYLIQGSVIMSIGLVLGFFLLRKSKHDAILKNFSKENLVM